MHELVWFGYAWGKKKHIEGCEVNLRAHERLAGTLKRLVSTFKRTNKSRDELIAILEAVNFAYKAVIVFFQRAHPDSPLFKKADVWRRGTRFGEPKLAYHKIWAEAFDAEARKLGIKNPELKRED